MSEKFSQDPLEIFFGCQRQRGHSSDNPALKEVLKNTQALRLYSSGSTAEAEQGLLVMDRITVINHFQNKNAENDNRIEWHMSVTQHTTCFRCVCVCMYNIAYIVYRNGCVGCKLPA